MALHLTRLILVLHVCAWLIACSPGAESNSPSVREISNPGDVSARYPFTAQGVNGNSVQMSWLEVIEGNTSLKWAAFDGSGWSEPEVIHRGEDFFVNWADFPSIASFGNAPVAAHWLQKVAQSTYAYHVILSFRSESGLWSEPITPHADLSASEHGFVSMLAVGDDRIFALWLDGHQTGEGKPMTLHSAMLNRDSRIGEEMEVDASVCDCCQTAMARSGDSMIAVYRDRTRGEIRDIYRAVYDLNGGQWGEPEALSEEGWEIAGCPVNGPQIVAQGEMVIATWFSAADNQPGSYLAVSQDGGQGFSGAQRIDIGNTAGRVGIALNRNGVALITWVEFKTTQAMVHGRLWRDNHLEDAFIIGKIDPSRASGFPRVAALESDFVVAWTRPSSEGSTGADTRPGIITRLVSPSGQ